MGSSLPRGTSSFPPGHHFSFERLTLVSAVYNHRKSKRIFFSFFLREEQTPSLLEVNYVRLLADWIDRAGLSLTSSALRENTSDFLGARVAFPALPSRRKTGLSPGSVHWA